MQSDAEHSKLEEHDVGEARKTEEGKELTVEPQKKKKSNRGRGNVDKKATRSWTKTQKKTAPDRKGNHDVAPEEKHDHLSRKRTFYSS